jgi:hypothetical protein
VATELTSTTITNILEAVPGIKTVLRSPAADAMVNLTRAAAGVGPFEMKDARELMRFAFRRGLINNEEHDHVLTDVEGAVQARQSRLAARQSARDDKKRVPSRPKAAAAKKPKPHVVHASKKSKAAPKKAARPAAKKPKPSAKAHAKKPKPSAKSHVKKPKPSAKSHAKKPKPSAKSHTKKPKPSAKSHAKKPAAKKRH